LECPGLRAFGADDVDDMNKIEIRRQLASMALVLVVLGIAIGCGYGPGEEVAARFSIDRNSYVLGEPIWVSFAIAT
jgi:hypothetical protein